VCLIEVRSRGRDAKQQKYYISKNDKNTKISLAVHVGVYYNITGYYRVAKTHLIP